VVHDETNYEFQEPPLNCVLFQRIGATFARPTTSRRQRAPLASTTRVAPNSIVSSALTRLPRSISTLPIAELIDAVVPHRDPRRQPGQGGFPRGATAPLSAGFRDMKGVTPLPQYPGAFQTGRAGAIVVHLLARHYAM
jgi:hypothetical protein